ncbi:MAG: DUF177 domain-containing protein [Candidatus Korobacteraceae bacterium]
MLIRVQDLEIRRQEFHEQLPPGAIDFGAELRQLGVMKVDGRAELVREHRGSREYVRDIRLVGELAGRVELNCARCLEPVGQEVTRSFDLLYRPLGVDRGKEEVSISQAETEIGYYQGEGLELEEALREQVLLAVPLKAVCRAECKGLCPHCGQNLNEGGCGCHEKQEDVRWHALRDLKQHLQ